MHAAHCRLTWYGELDPAWLTELVGAADSRVGRLARLEEISGLISEQHTIHQQVVKTNTRRKDERLDNSGSGWQRNVAAQRATTAVDP